MFDDADESVLWKLIRTLNKPAPKRFRFFKVRMTFYYCQTSKG